MAFKSRCKGVRLLRGRCSHSYPKLRALEVGTGGNILATRDKGLGWSRNRKIVQVGTRIRFRNIWDEVGIWHIITFVLTFF